MPLLPSRLSLGSLCDAYFSLDPSSIVVFSVRGLCFSFAAFSLHALSHSARYVQCTVALLANRVLSHAAIDGFRFAICCLFSSTSNLQAKNPIPRADKRENPHNLQLPHFRQQSSGDLSVTLRTSKRYRTWRRKTVNTSPRYVHITLFTSVSSIV